MQMPTQEELLLEGTLSATQAWAALYKPANLLVTENNAFNITIAIKQYIHQTGRKPSPEKVDEIVKSLGDIRTGGKLQYEQIAPLPVNPADPANFPHSRDPQLKWLDSIDSYKNATVDKIRRYTQPAAFGEMTRDASRKTLNERFNERVQFLRDNKIRKGAEPPTNGQTSGAPRDPNANAVLNEVLGTINNYSGRTHAQSSKRREVLKQTYDRFVGQVRTVADAEKLGRTIDSQIHRWESSSIN